ncbi:EVE domain-containing protein [Rhodoferax sp. WC2427]|uniref:EVE domain-containing protein n=1 Tax=Rhodoferax sp. WC2427 TaxID=3234144 RepID=UPI0034654C84
MSAPRHNWIAVASAQHARRGCAPSDGPGYMQVCHGKAAPLKKVRAGDRVAYYAPTLTMGGKDRLQCFVSIGLVLAGDAYSFDMGGGFVPYRKDVQYVAAQEASILPLVPQFEFVESPQHWGYKFRFGLFAISDHDMRLIAQAMQADLAALHLAPLFDKATP